MLPITRPTPLPTVAVLPSKFMAGIKNLDDPADGLTVQDFEAAMTAEWASDAHFVCYRPSAQFPQNEWPRLTKPVLSKIRALGGDVLLSMFAFDYDNPGHRPWEGEAQWNDWCEQLVTIACQWELAGQWTLAYATRHGARLVYVLQEPISADKAEGHHRWMVDKFTEMGLRLDPACSDWTRVFRLPFVTRDSKPTWTMPEASWFMWQPDQRLRDVASLPVVEGKDRSKYGDIESIDDPKPDQDDCIHLIRTPSLQPTEWCKAAKKHLRGREAYDILFNHVPIARAGGRNNAIHKFVGQVIGVLVDHQVEGTSPEHVYALFLEPVQQLEPDGDTPDWTVILWDHVRRLWAKQVAKIKEVEIVQEQKAQAVAETEFKVLGTWEKIIAGMREWCDNSTLHSNANNGRDAIEWASQHLIVTMSQLFYVMTKEGRYYPEPLLSEHVIPHINRHGLTDIIPTMEIDGNGIAKTKTLRDIMGTCGSIAHDIRITPQQIAGGYLEHPDTPFAQLVCPMFQRNTDLEPTYDPHVDEWLKQLFGLDYELAVKWIGWALAFDEGGIAALSLKSEQGAGKKMLVQGLAECLRRPALADHSDLTSNYQYGLLKSPFLCINEGFPRMSRDITPYHTFRLLVSGDGIRANRKNMHPVEIRCPYRILFTANNDNIVESLVGTGNLSPEDRAALAIRLIHLEVGDRATNWLRSMGGMSLTARPGRRWIGGDGGEPTDFIVAKHFLYLYHNRKGPKGARLLVEGNCGQDVMFKLRTQGGAAPLVIEAIVKMLNETMLRDGIATDNDRLYVLPQEILDFFRLRMANTSRETLTGRALLSVLKGLCLREFPNPITLKSKEKMGRRRWMELDPAALLSAAERLGDSCKRLDQLVAVQKTLIGKDQSHDIASSG